MNLRLSPSSAENPPWYGTTRQRSGTVPIPILGAKSPPKPYGSFVNLDYFKHIKLTPEITPARNSLGLSFGLDVTTLLDTHSQDFLLNLV